MPRLLRPLVIDRRPTGFLDADSSLLSRMALGPEAWTRLSAETCRRLALLVVDRVQTRLSAIPDLILDTPLPEPSVALTLALERRTSNTIRRALRERSPRPWTVGRYLALDRFGGRALVDLVAAAQARADRAMPVAVPAGEDHDEEMPTARSLDESLALLARLQPISEQQASTELRRRGLANGPVDARALAQTAVRLGRNAPFHVIDLGGSRMIVRLSDLTAARTVYRIAARAVQGWGAAPIRGVADRLRIVGQAVVATSFVERVLSGISSFRWLDRKNGWFWFVQRFNPLVDHLRKIFSVATRVPLARLWNALFRTRIGPPPSFEVIQQICAAVPGTQLNAGEVLVDRPFDRRTHLSETENQIALLLEKASAGMSRRDLRGATHRLGLPWAPVSRLLRCSPLIEEAPDGLFHLVGRAPVWASVVVGPTSG